MSKVEIKSKRVKAIIGISGKAITRKGYFYILRQSKGCYFLCDLVTNGDVTGTIWQRERNYPTTLGHHPDYRASDIYICNLRKEYESNPFKYISIEFERFQKWSLKIKY